MSEQKFCKDCRWFGETAPKEPRCHHPKIKTVDSVYGEDIPGFPGILRSQTDTANPCGVSGNLWEPVPPCEHCGNRPATCYGAYEGGEPCYACDDCCSHGNEDGHCEPVNGGDHA